MTTDEKIGAYVKKRRRALSLRQIDMEGVHHKTIAKLEKGETSPTVKTLEAIADNFNMTFLDFLHEALKDPDSTTG